MSLDSFIFYKLDFRSINKIFFVIVVITIVTLDDYLLRAHLRNINTSFAILVIYL